MGSQTDVLAIGKVLENVNISVWSFNVFLSLLFTITKEKNALTSDMLNEYFARSFAHVNQLFLQW